MAPKTEFDWQQLLRSSNHLPEHLSSAFIEHPGEQCDITSDARNIRKLVAGLAGLPLEKGWSRHRREHRLNPFFVLAANACAAFDAHSGARTWQLFDEAEELTPEVMRSVKPPEPVYREASHRLAALLRKSNRKSRRLGKRLKDADRKVEALQVGGWYPQHENGVDVGYGLIGKKKPKNKLSPLGLKATDPRSGD